MILEKVAFRGIFDRERDVKSNFPDTFQWILKGSSQNQKWPSLIDWLRTGSGCYWINGKAASGKSTLMRFLSQQTETREALQQWARGHEHIHIANFFFWHLGNSLQKSQVGLIRSLLYSILVARKALIEKLFPAYFRELTEHVRLMDMNKGILPFHVSPPSDPSDQEFKNAFFNIVQNTQGRQKICFFIDGIDEFDGNHYELSELLMSICGSDVKMVLSSRPIPACVQSFRGCPTLKLQDLTRQDLHLYINNRLRAHSRMQYLLDVENERARRLIIEILSRADGVFLWVVLVVSSLLQGLHNFDTIHDLEQRLDYFPRELEELYQYMMDQMEPLYRRKRSEYLQIVLRSLDTDAELTLLKMSFADEDPTVVLSPDWQVPDHKVWKQRMNETEARIISRCGGLVEVGREDMSSPAIGPGPYVYFLHKTVADFLRQPKVLKSVTEFTSMTPFNPSLALLSSTLQLAKIFTRQFKMEGRCRLSAIRTIMRQAQHAESAGVDITEYFNEFSRYESITGGRFDWRQCFPPPSPPARLQSIYPERHILFLPVWYGLTGCVTRMLTEGPDDWVNKECPDLLWAVSSKDRLQSIRETDELLAIVSTIKALLQYGSNPNLEISQTTAWRNILVEIIDCDTSKASHKSRIWTTLEVYFDLIVTFLKAGADPHVAIAGRVKQIMKPGSGKPLTILTSERSVSAWIEDLLTHFLGHPSIPYWTKDALTRYAGEAGAILADLQVTTWRTPEPSSLAVGNDIMLGQASHTNPKIPLHSQKRSPNRFSKLTRNLALRDKHGTTTSQPADLESSGPSLEQLSISQGRSATRSHTVHRVYLQSEVLL